MKLRRDWLAPAHFIVPIPNAIAGLVVALLTVSLRDTLVVSVSFAVLVSCLLLPWRRREFESVVFAEKACGHELRYANYVLDELPALVVYSGLLLLTEPRASASFLVIDSILLATKCIQFAYHRAAERSRG